MPLLVLAHLVAAALIFAVGRRVAPRVVIALALVAPVVGVVALASEVPGVRDGEAPTWSGRWVPALDIGFSFRLDGFALLMGLIVSGIGALVLAYSGPYFGPGVDRARLTRFAGAFVAFAGAMLGLVLADDIWTLFIFWELTSVTSFALIGLDDEGAKARAAAQRALLVTAAGGLALMGGLVLVAQAAGGTTFAELADAPTARTTVQVGLVLILIGAFTKSAQVPFQFWLPGAMAAPTPVSAYLHSATMVKAGIVLVGRLAPMYAEVSWWRPTLVVVGGLTMALGGVGALRQSDAKLLLANGTVSQLGFLMLLFGIGHPDVTAAGVAVLVGHALFKAPLFLAVGVVDHSTGTRDIRRLSGVGRALPWIAALTGLAAASMAGLPPLLGFAAKEAALDTLLKDTTLWSRVAVAAVCLGSVLTVAYTARLWRGLFTDHALDPAEGDPIEVHHRPSLPLVAPVAVLVAATVLGGLLSEPLGEELAIAAEALDADSHGHLTLWAGVKPALILSILIVAAGAGLHLLLARGARVPAPRVSGERAFQSAFDGLLSGARRLTAVVQNGSLPAYVAVVFSVLVVAMATAALDGAVIGDEGAVVSDGPLQIAVATLAAGMAIALVAARQRVVSVLMLGTVGYALAGIFLIHGAPDLALTQVLVETITLVVFLLVLRHLPESYSPPPEWAPRGVRVAIAVAVGLGVGGFALAAGTLRADRPVADEMVALSEPEAGGRNVVNVILVDFRGVDTLGEITVLAIAAAGIANLVRAARRDRVDGRDPFGDPEDDLELNPRPAEVGPRSIIFDQITRVAFPIILLVSLYVTFRGHNAPGGGFAGGLIAGTAFVMRYLSGGQPVLRRHKALPTSGLIGAGLAVAVATGLTATLAGDPFLTSSIAKVDVPLMGEIKLVSSTAFDIGVYLLVLGVVLSVLTHLGAQAPRRDREVAP